MTETLVYLAHPVRGHSKIELLSSITTWLGQLVQQFPDHAFAAPWLPYVLALDDGSQTHRDRGMRDDMEFLIRCDEVWLLGETVSEGMLEEADWARKMAMPVRRVLRRGAEVVVSDEKENQING